MRIPSLTLRLTLLFGAIFAMVLVGLGGFVVRIVEHHFEEGDLQELYAKLDLTRYVLSQVRSVDAFVHVPQQLDAALVGHRGLSIALVRANGELIFVSSGAPFPAEEIGTPPPIRAAARPPARLWRRGDAVYRGIITDVPSADPTQPPVRVAVSLDIGHHRAFMTTFKRSLWLAIALSIGLSAILGWLAARRGLTPLQDMARVARGVSAQSMHDRIRETELPVELHKLAGEFNAMMDRLEDAFRRLSEFSSDIAHELRTPISNLMTQTQVALTRARSNDEYRDILHSNLEEFDRLARMIADMLFLAKADNGLLPRPAEVVELEKEALALTEFYEAVADEKDVRMVVSGGATVTGDRLMLRRALSNLLSNALRHTPAGGTVTIALTQNDGIAQVAVRNPGPSIPPEHLPRLFQRFHRVDFSRTRNGDGAGLGLAITRSIVEAHGGEVNVKSAQGLTVFSLTLPIGQNAAPGGDAWLRGAPTESGSR